MQIEVIAVSTQDDPATLALVKGPLQGPIRNVQHVVLILSHLVGNVACFIR
jgi:hypothetical protein